MLYILLGPTSTGKTSLAIELCQKINGEIISADSRQVVKKMTIGTGKFPANLKLPIREEDSKYIINDVSIWGYDLVEPTDYFSAYDFAVFAGEKLKAIEARGKNVFLVGGTGFYIDPLIGRTSFSAVSPDLELRKQLESQDLDALVKQLDDPTKLDVKNKVRVVRALEVQLRVKNQLASSMLPNGSVKVERYVPTKIIGLTADRAVLYANVDNWVDIIWHNGLLEEVSELLTGNYANSWRLNGLVYKSVVAYLSGTLFEHEAIQRIKFDLHAYIRRQQTWFKRNPDILWFDITETDYRQKILDLVQ